MWQKCAYQYRFYPTKEQQQMLARTFGCVRYVYNWALRLRIDTYKAEKRGLSTNELSKRLTILKQQKDVAFLSEVSSVSLQQSLRHLADAFTNFFAGRAGYPTFKARHDKQSAEYTKSAFTWDGQALRLAKMEDPLDIRWSRPLPEGVTPTTVIVSKDTAGRYFVSIRLEQEMAQLPPCNKVVGLDLGLKSMVVTSDGEAIGNPKFFARDEKKLARAQRRLCKKKKGSRRPPSVALPVAMSLKPFRLRCASGPAPRVASTTTATSMRQTISWPRDSRWLPVERLQDLNGRNPNRASLDEAGRLSREGANPRPITAWGGCQVLGIECVVRDEKGYTVRLRCGKREAKETVDAVEEKEQQQPVVQECESEGTWGEERTFLLPQLTKSSVNQM